MFPITSLLVGSGMLWSVSPSNIQKVANLPTSMTLSIGAKKFERPLTEAEQDDLLSYATKLQLENRLSQYETAYKVTVGLQVMQDNGDRRIASPPAFFEAPLAEYDRLARLESTHPAPGSVCEMFEACMEVHNSYMTLEDEALAAYEALPAQDWKAFVLDHVLGVFNPPASVAA